MNPSDEILDIVDENDVVVGQAPRGEATARGLRHRCVFIEARDAEGRVFVHRRTATKLVFPAHYDMFVGGVVGAGGRVHMHAHRHRPADVAAADHDLFTVLHDDDLALDLGLTVLLAGLAGQGRAPGGQDEGGAGQQPSVTDDLVHLVQVAPMSMR